MNMTFATYPNPGIDVSHNNGEIDWSKVVAKGTAFAGIRVGYGRVIDTQFKTNWAAAKKKVCRIPYWYLDYYSNHNEGSPVNGMSDEEWGRDQARNCWRFFDGDFEGSVFLDVEDGNKNYAPSVHTVLPRVICMMNAFYKEIDRLSGKTNGAYLSLSYLKFFVGEFGDRPLWVAWYTKTKTMEDVRKAVKAAGWTGPLLIWQWASDGDADGNTTPDGLAFGMQYGFLDLNFWCGTREELIKLCGWIPSGVVVVADPDLGQEEDPVLTAGDYVVTAAALNLRSCPSTAQTAISKISQGTKVTVIQVVDGPGSTKGWAKIEAYVSLDYLQKK